MASWILRIGASAVQAHLQLRVGFADAILLIFVQIFAVVAFGVITINAIDIATDWQLLVCTGAVVALFAEFVFAFDVAANFEVFMDIFTVEARLTIFVFSSDVAAQ